MLDAELIDWSGTAKREFRVHRSAQVGDIVSLVVHSGARHQTRITEFICTENEMTTAFFGVGVTDAALLIRYTLTAAQDAEVRLATRWCCSVLPVRHMIGATHLTMRNLTRWRTCNREACIEDNGTLVCAFCGPVLFRETIAGVPGEGHLC